MPQITRRLEFDAGHRVLGHEGKCKHLHGHRYVAEVAVEAQFLDGLSRVVDFGVVKQLVGGWIDDNWDHNILLNERDPLLETINIPDVWEGREPYVIPDGNNPTAEVLAELLFVKACELLRPYEKLEVYSVRLYETPNCWADYKPQRIDAEYRPCE